MAGDYIPGGDAPFHAWQNNFVTYVNTHLADLGLDAADVAPLNTAQATWNTDYPAHTAAQTAARGAREAKDGARSGFVEIIRELVRRLQASPDVDDAERAAMGITVPDREGSPEGPPTTRPVVNVDTSQRLQHTIHFADEATPTRLSQTRERRDRPRRMVCPPRPSCDSFEPWLTRMIAQCVRTAQVLSTVHSTGPGTRSELSTRRSLTNLRGLCRWLRAAAAVRPRDRWPPP